MQITDLFLDTRAMPVCSTINSGAPIIQAHIANDEVLVAVIV